MAKPQLPQAKYLVEGEKFIVENYNWAKPFADFFPGIGGKFGVPMYIYYVSRNQCICTMGVRDKDNAILEFQSFNKALAITGKQSFRTLIKEKGQGEVYEPFHKTLNQNIQQRLSQTSAELAIEENNLDLNLTFQVEYFPLVLSSTPAFIRMLTIKNTGTVDKTYELLDGVARVICHGMNRAALHVTARHIEGMIETPHIDGSPVFRLKQDPADKEIIKKLDGGNFYFSLVDQHGNLALNANYIIDPEVIFADAANYDRAFHFETQALEKLLSREQVNFNRTPCAFTAQEVTLAAGQSMSLYTVMGRVAADNQLARFRNQFLQPQFLQEKRKENYELINGIKNHVFTLSGDSKFDEYMGQTFLDNAIRGGLPVAFDTAMGKAAFYMFSRQNGDLERDYHNIVLEPTYYSQGTGHYRSVNQNRRNDCLFFTDIEDYNIYLFLNLIQTDGYNPIEVNEVSYLVENLRAVNKILAKLAPRQAKHEKVKELLGGSFSPGQFTMLFENLGIKNHNKLEKLLSSVLLHCREDDIGGVHEGFWVDHWFYNLDLIDNFLAVFPDRLFQLLLGRKNYTLYDNVDVILPRSAKYVISDGKVRQYGAVERDLEKIELLATRRKEAAKVRIKQGKGKIYQTHLLAKLLIIIVNRVANYDQAGLGQQMESDKPGWNDSMNGLPGIIGSSMCESLELERALKFLLQSLRALEGRVKTVKLYSELADFVTALQSLLKKRLQSGFKGAFEYWQKSSNLKEKYRSKTRLGILGSESQIDISKLISFCEKALALSQEANGAKAAFNKQGLVYTYLENQAIKFKPVKKQAKAVTNHLGYPLAQVNSFKQRPLKAFLEGPMHYLRVYKENAPKTYKAVKNSKLWDEKLKMYKVCESLKNETFEIGRVHAWPSGWIENESIYAHMEYKYLLEILRAGLYDEFFEDIKTGISPFLDPAIFGRSIFQNVSFYVSSAYANEADHGRGFQARLSGVTSEMISMWLIMVAGEYPFQLEKEQLSLKLDPTLPVHFFTSAKKSGAYFDGKEWQQVSIDKNCFAFKFLNKTLVIYHNPKKKNTYGKNGVKPQRFNLTFANGKTVKINSTYLSAPEALAVRDGRVRRIEIELG